MARGWQGPTSTMPCKAKHAECISIDSRVTRWVCTKGEHHPVSLRLYLATYKAKVPWQALIFLCAPSSPCPSLSYSPALSNLTLGGSEASLHGALLTKCSCIRPSWEHTCLTTVALEASFPPCYLHAVSGYSSEDLSSHGCAVNADSADDLVSATAAAPTLASGYHTYDVLIVGGGQVQNRDQNSALIFGKSLEERGCTTEGDCFGLAPKTDSEACALVSRYCCLLGLD